MGTPYLHDLDVTVATPTVCLAGRDGQLRAGGVHGVICGDVRVLDRAVVTVDGVEPEPVGPEVGVLPGMGGPGRDPAVWLRRSRTVAPDGVAETLTLENRSADAIDATLEVTVGADLARIEEIRDGRSRPAAVAVIDGDAVVWRDGAVVVRLAAPGATVDGARLTWSVQVPGRGSVAVRWTLAVTDPGAVVAAAATPVRRPTRPVDRGIAALLDRSLRDLDGLLAVEPGSADLFAAAGAPWYLTLFGRDALWTATLLLPVDPRIAAGTVRTLARLQGTGHDPASGEQPGKILHERRRGTTVHGGGLVLPPVYYGTIDATPLWITLLRDAWRHGMPDAEVAALRPNLDAALGWLRDHSDRDGDGFAEYLDESGHGLANQGWKDSVDAIRYPDGRIADGPVALCEVQGYAHEAALAGAELLDAFGGDGAPWRAWAAALADRFRAAFWVRDAQGPFPALALDGAKRPVDTPTSNIGHLLGTGLLDAAETEAVGARLVSPALASGYGLRTMSAAAGGYSPLSYHCGSVWPHDTAIAIRGLLRTGQHERAAVLAGQLLDAAAALGWQLPELFGGFGRDEVAAPVPYPRSCRPQAWSAAAAVVVAEALAP
jgi:glycogen debranching enzyme